MADKNNYVGEQIGNYRIVAEIARGGFGSVYQGEHLILSNRIAAIKLLHALFLDSIQERDRFISEARLLERLRHPAILSIIDVGTYNDSPYIVTEYLSNGSLRRLMEQQTHNLPFADSMNILTQVGEALQHAHDQNIIHRDIKPDNILFNANNEALLADFGIAIVLETSSFKFTSIIGTPKYMSPEQFRGTVSKESDQYSLGCLAYELFAGQPPFQALDPMSMGFKHISELPVAPRNINPNIPIHIEQAILKAISKERSQRHISVRAFISAMQDESIESIQQFEPLFVPEFPILPTTVQTPGLLLDVAQLTNTGQIQPPNTDDMGYVIPKDNQIMAQKGSLFIVTDGLHGNKGEVASEIAVSTVASTYYQDENLDIPFSLSNAIRQANQQVYQRRQKGTFFRSMRTTCLATILCGDRAFIANVGNSRAYLLRHGELRQITQDHTRTAELIRTGILQPSSRSARPQDDITRTLGTKKSVEVDIFTELIQVGDLFLLCTDGLYEYVSEDEIRTIMGPFLPQEIVYYLIERANENGGGDNITAIVVRVNELGASTSRKRPKA